MKLFIKLSLLISLLFPAFAYADPEILNQPDFKAFIDKMVTVHHFDRSKLIDIFKTVKPVPQVIANIKHPLEKETWKLYQRVFINDNYIQEGAAFRKEWHKTLVKAEKKYGVPGSIIIATLGVETKYGTHSGGFRVLDSLSNLSFTGQRRAPFFQEELRHFLLLCRENHLDPLQVQGSYAGAIGAPQFMPSSYRYFAASFKNKPYIDIINNKQDAIASIGRYYKEHGWKNPNLVAIPATVEGDNYLKLTKPDGSLVTFSSSELSQYQITPQRKIPKGYKLQLIELEGQNGKEYWLVFDDFNVIKRYNPSNLYAMAVFQLSRRILEYNK
jgi:membrane-bound lytic murein transglycosylase B